jgi:predicted transposase YbfD/YdcC
VALTAYLAEASWSQIQQVLRVEQLVREQSGCTREVRDFVTSLDTRLSASDLLHLVRAHGRIENTLHGVRDVMLGQDASTVRRDSVPRVVAALRNTVLGLFYQRRWRNIAAALRHYAWHPVTNALRFLGISLT